MLWNQVFGQKLAKAREKLGYSQAKFARHFNIGVDAYRKWEQGRSKPSKLEYIVTMIKVFGKDADFILEYLGLEPSDLEPLISQPPQEKPYTIIESRRQGVRKVAEKPSKSYRKPKGKS